MLTALRKPTLTTGLSNAIVTGLLTWLSLRSIEAIPLSLDSIRAGSGSVFGRAVGSSFVSAFLLTLLTFATTRKNATAPGSPLAPLRTNASLGTFARTALRHAIFAFGAVTLVAVLWQRFAGTIVVSRVGASLIAALLSGVTAATVTHLTLVEMLRRAQIGRSSTSGASGEPAATVGERAPVT